MSWSLMGWEALVKLSSGSRLLCSEQNICSVEDSHRDDCSHRDDTSLKRFSFDPFAVFRKRRDDGNL